ncbi:MAG: N-acetylmuramoyl-L-alanine amidase [Ginsengibacter sp.]
MITLISWYFLKVLIVSGVLCGYYFLALKDKIFHKWNRFYLLFSVVLSIILPLIRVNIFDTSSGQGSVIKVLRTITVQDEIVIELGKNSAYSTNLFLVLGYALVSLFFIATFIFTLIKIRRLRERNEKTQVNGINFINTNADGTPFSFFNSIFWNRTIDLNSIAGQQILDHEIAHIRERHTYDKIFINVVLLFFWLNPFFWLIRKELNMIHEFIADKIALEDDDISAFSEMILSSVYPQKQFFITNNFFYSPIKRRLLMLTKNKNSKVNYVSRLFALLLASIVFFAFSLKMKKAAFSPIYSGKTLNVIIDAGHGGEEYGGREGNYYEKDLALSIAKDVKSLNQNKNINILLTRNSDQNISLKERVQFAKDNNADLFISIHLDAATTKIESKGVNIMVPKDGNVYLTKSKLLGSSVMAAFKNNYTLPTSPELLQLPQGIYILKENQYPAILIQAACISAEKDLSYIGKPENQKIIASNILQGIENYAQNNLVAVESNNSLVSDTIPQMSYKGKKVTGLTVKVNSGNVLVKYKDGSTESISQKEAMDRGFVLPPPPPPAPYPSNMPPPPPPPSDMPPPPPPAVRYHKGKKIKSIAGVSNDRKVILTYTNGTREIISAEEAEKAGFIFTPPKVIKDNVQFTPPKIVKEKVQYAPPNIVKDEEVDADVQPVAGSNSGETQQNMDKIFTQVEEEAHFPGGQDAWAKYITGAVNRDIDKLSKPGNYGTVIVRFIVGVNGEISAVEATTMKGTQLAKTAVESIKKGPKWIPAQQNGKAVNAYRLQPVTLKAAVKK